MILLVNGPNLNLLGEREPPVHGSETLAEVERMVTEACAAYGIRVKAFQSNSEGALIDFLQAHRRDAQGVILNPGAFTHTSRAIPDCLRALPCPTIEVHIANVHGREEWRRESFVAPATMGQIVGLGVSGYHYAALHLCALITARAVAREEGAGASEGGARSAREQLRWAREQARQTASGRSGPTEPRDRPASDGQRIPEEGEPIPVDLNARGDYEPL
jgi:3-dehydroquinate dehydratase-2